MSTLASLNARPNGFRRVAYSEHENDHLHRVLRHFPELQTSLQQVKTMQEKVGRNWTDRDPVRAERPREVKYKSTHRLGELSKSSLDEFRAPMDEMRKVLMKSRELSRGGSSSSTGLRGIDTKNVGTAPGEEGGSGSGVEEEEDDLGIAERKLTKASLSFDPRGTINVLSGFQGKALTVTELDSQLRRGLSIVLHKRELHALFTNMDKDGSGLIDGVEFTRYFLQMGIDERKRKKMDVLRKTWAAEAEERARHERERDQILQWQAEQISAFSPEDEARVYKKLCEVALAWDSTSDINEVKLRGFDMYLTPYDFKVQLSRSFDLRLSGAEVGALLKKFITKEGELACVNGNAFLKFFTRLKKEVKLNHSRTLAGLQERKRRVLNMGQQPTILATLGR